MRRNRIKAVINVPRSRPSQQHDRPLTPITSNHDRPSSPAVHNHNHNSPHPQQSSPAYRSASPLASPKTPHSNPSAVEYNGYPYPSLVLVKSPPSLTIPQATPGKSPVPDLVPLSPAASPGGYFHKERSLTPDSVRSPSFPFSPGGIQRPSPSASPNHSTNLNLNSPALKYFSPSPHSQSSNHASTTALMPFVSPPHRPSHQSPSRNPVFFSTNSNSADSHEVERYMSQSHQSLPSPRGSAEVQHKDSHNNRSSTNTPSSGGAFSSVMKDHAHSIVNDSKLLRARLNNPTPSVTVSKFQALRKEFLAKNDTPERKQLTMLHFAFWNPPAAGKDKEKKINEKKARSRAASVCSNRSVKSNEESSVAAAKDENVNDTKVNINGRRATVEVAPLGNRSSLDQQHDEKSSDTVMSESSQASQNSQTSQESVHIGPRVKVGPDGQLIIDEQSLVVETSESQRAKKQLSEMETVSGTDFIVGSSGMFRNKRKPKRGHDWTVKETIRFYRALSMCGTDFSMMTTLFTNRSRAEIKAKFKREDRKNPGQISLALAYQDFDPDEGITEEEEDEDEDIVITGSSIKRQRKRKAKSRIDDQIQEELEVERTTASARPATATPTNSLEQESPVNLLNLKKEKGTPQKNKKGTGAVRNPEGRPKVPWKCSKTVVNDLGEVIKIKKEKVSNGGKPKKGRIKRQKLSGHLDDPDHPANANATNKKGRAKKTKEPAVPKRKKLKFVRPTVETPLPEILRYDPADPLGLKVVTSAPSYSLGDLDAALSHVNSAINSNSNSNDNVNNESAPKAGGIRRRSSRNSSGSGSRDEYETKSEKFMRIAENIRAASIKPPANVKALSFRVPGPGGGPPVTSNSPIVDEIEIEISCQ